MGKFFACLATAILIFSSNTFSQKPAQPTSSEILHEMKKLNVLGSVLYMAAHPDDENTRLLAYMSKARQFRTGYMSMTRGDGGQNLIGDEQGIELGLIRTQELLAARRMDGAEQFFSRAYDFGFSKRTEEALTTWNKEKILSDAVWVIRNFRPDIIIARFPEDARAGHGHHSASAVIAREAFIAAADPSRFPEQFIHGVRPWQAKRIMWNTFSFGNTNTTSNDQLKIDVGSFVPLIGKSIGEIAAESRSNHRSQGFGSAATRGTALEYFVHIAGEKALSDPMDGVVTSWDRVEGGTLVKSMIDQLIKTYDIANPAASLSQLISIRRALRDVKDAYWQKQKGMEVDKLIQQVSGLHVEAIASRQSLSFGDTLRVNILFNNRSGAEISVSSIETPGPIKLYNDQLSKNQNWQQSFSIPVTSDMKITQPYWLEQPLKNGSFDVQDQLLIGKAENDPAFVIKARFNILGDTVLYEVPVKYRFVDPAKGEFLQPVYIIPTHTVDVAPQPRLIRQTGNQPESHSIKTEMEVTPTVRHQIQYEHIPALNYFSEGKEMKVVVDLKTAGKKIGYIVGAGDKVPAMLQLMGYEVTILKREDISLARLNQFDAIVTGVRAFNVFDWLFEKNDVLTEYVRQGGNLVIQYNTNSNVGPMRDKVGPKPFIISRNRVTEEDAAVTILDEKDPILNFPNKITQVDFNGWIQERGIYFAEDFDKDYKPLLSMHDQGESEMNGSLIVRKEGKGRFIYTGLVFFRELPAGVPGAFRLFANIISNPNRKINESK